MTHFSSCNFFPSSPFYDPSFVIVHYFGVHFCGQKKLRNSETQILSVKSNETVWTRDAG